MAPREDIEFKTGDGVTLRGWFFKATTKAETAPCIVMANGWSCIKEFYLDDFAAVFQASGMHVVAYDHRGFGNSDTGVDAPRLEIIPSQQISDWSDAITYAQNRTEVDPKRIGVWGTSYAGGHVLQLGATDKRIKAVCSQVPFVSGSANTRALVRSDFIPAIFGALEADRHARAKGEKPGYMPVADQNATAPWALPISGTLEFFNSVDVQKRGKGKWENSVTTRSMEYNAAYEPGRFIDLISPTPLLMTVAENDVLTPVGLALDAYAKAKEPKQLNILRGAGHFDSYTGKWFKQNSDTQAAFFKKALFDE